MTTAGYRNTKLRNLALHIRERVCRPLHCIEQRSTCHLCSRCTHCAEVQELSLLFVNLKPLTAHLQLFSKCGFCENLLVLRGAALLLALLQGFSACFNLQAKRVLVAFCASRKFKLKCCFWLVSAFLLRSFVARKA